MGKILVLAEKPSVGKELARVLGCNASHNGYMEGSRYIVTWSLGHLVTLADPEHYGDQFKKWDLETLPMIPPKMELVVIKDTGKQYKVVKDLLHRPDVDELVIATDAGREGELVARWIIQMAGFRKKTSRLWISSQTDNAIKEGFAKLHPASEYDNLFQSAYCRAEADWLVGLNVSRALTCKYNASLSAGRVQTPTLAIIVMRENEINSFVPKTFYNVTANLKDFNMSWKDKVSGQARIFEKEKADEIVRKVTGGTAKVLEVKKEHIKEAAPLLYDLTELQRDANKHFSYSAKQTLNIMQSLYEIHKLLTYPRTDSRHLTTDIVPTLPERLRSISFGAYASHAAAIIRGRIVATKRFVDDSKVSDHHAIIPTEQHVDINKLTADERKVYDLVVKRFLAVLSPEFEYEKTSVKAEIAGEIFTANGKIIKSAGWKNVYLGIDIDENQTETEEKEQSLPDIKKGDSFPVVKVTQSTGKTKPPARYTEATLLTAMEHPGKFIENEDMRAVMNETKGIGTPATRADIIEKLFNSNCIERRGKEIFPMSKGIQLLELVPQELKSPELTAAWEQKLAAISKGTAKSLAFSTEIKSYVVKLISNIKVSSANYRHDNVTKERCPNCDKFLLEINGKKGKMLACPDRECGYRSNLSFISNARCPTCHKKLEITGDGEKRLYICKCGFREKFDSFNKKLSESNNNASKRELVTYMQKQQEEKSDTTSAFAAAWEKAAKSKNK
ncbi:MAG: DNA topoisomerase III [Saccharofermentanales bacterium]